MIIKDKEYWHNKHPVVDQTYNGRPLPNGKSYSMDVRNFIWPDDVILKTIIKGEKLEKDSFDESALAVQRYVVKHLKYTSDKKLGRSEYWMFPIETLLMAKDDCEGGACLIASLLCNILPVKEHWRVRVAAGWVQESPTAPQGGHGYCTYCRMTDSEWVALDWCYFEDSRIRVADKRLHKNNVRYKDIWFSFNRMYSYSHTKFDLTGRVSDAKSSDR